MLINFNWQAHVKLNQLVGEREIELPGANPRSSRELTPQADLKSDNSSNKLLILFVSLPILIVISGTFYILRQKKS